VRAEFGERAEAEPWIVSLRKQETNGYHIDLLIPFVSFTGVGRRPAPN